MEEFTMSLDMPVEHMQNLFGKRDSYIKKIEDEFHVMIVDRNGTVKVSGDRSAVEQAAHVVRELCTLSERGNQLDEQNIDYALEMGRESKEDVLLDIDDDCICHTIAGKPIKPKTLGQKQYVDAIWQWPWRSPLSKKTR
jgi:phosphate starvation-inducible PhoH-like protein